MNKKGSEQYGIWLQQFLAKRRKGVSVEQQLKVLNNLDDISYVKSRRY